jgi:hypothetical protein
MNRQNDSLCRAYGKLLLKTIEKTKHIQETSINELTDRNVI